MRCAIFCMLVGLCLLVGGCGGGGDSPPMADAGGDGGAPPSPGSESPPPPGSEDGGATPDGGAPPSDPGSGSGGENPAATGSPDGGTADASGGEASPLPGGDDSQGMVFFEQNIQPVLAANCFRCHSAEARELKGGLRLDTADGIRQGGDNGPVVIPGSPDDSLLIRALRHDGMKMPPARKLPDRVTADFVKWVAMGAPDPRLAGMPDGSTAGDGSFVGGEGLDPSLVRQRPRTLREQAIDALRAGNEKDAFRLYYTYLAIMPDASAELREKMAWIPALRRPALGPRIGIATVYMNPSALPRDFDDSPQPIGSSELAAAMESIKQAAAERRTGTGGDQGSGSSPQGTSPVDGEGGQGPGDSGQGSEAARQLKYYAGDFGTKFLDALKQRLERGDYGAAYKDLASESSRRPEPLDPNNPGDPGQLAGTGDGGAGLYGGSPDGGQGNDGAPGGSQAQGDSQRLGLAVVWLGHAKSKEELTQLAADANVDLLATFELTLRAAKNTTFVNNQTKLRIAPPKATKREEILYYSDALENRAVLQAREKGIKGEDPVDKEVKKAMEALDKACKPQPLPVAVTPENVKRRVGSLISAKPADPLAALVEARYYVTKGLLTDDDLSAASVALVGEAEYARMIAMAPGAGIDVTLGLSSVLDLVSRVNAVTGAASQAAAKAAGKGAPARGKGLKGLLPFGGGSGK